MAGMDGLIVRLIELASIHQTQWCWLNSLLDAAERERAAKFLFDRDRRQYIAAHALKRLMLSASAEGTMHPAAWKFETGPYGKPRIAGAAGPNFSLSHCDGMVACALSGQMEIGIDLESIARPVPVDVLDRYLAAEERAWLVERPQPLQAIEALRLWTLKEAYVKASGLGLSQRLDTFAFSFCPLRVTFHDPALGAPEDWWFEQRLIGSGSHILAVACHAVVAPVRVDVEVIRPEMLLPWSGAQSSK
jgi:4'-phosphopantetheinyl transferase